MSRRSDPDDPDVHDLGVDVEHGHGAPRLPATLHGRARIDVVLDVPAGVDVGLVPRDVGVTEQHDICLREPASEPVGSSRRRAAVVHHGDQPFADTDLDPLGQYDPTIVVAQHRLDGCDRGERVEDVVMNEVPGMEDGVDIVCHTGGVQPLHQAAALACAQVRVGHDQDSVHVGHGTIVVEDVPPRMNPVTEPTRRVLRRHD